MVKEMTYGEDPFGGVPHKEPIELRPSEESLIRKETG